MRLSCMVCSFFANVIAALFAAVVSAGGHDFALIGDQQYNAAQEAAFLNLIEDINKNNVLFTVQGAIPAYDEFFRRLYRANTSSKVSL